MNMDKLEADVARMREIDQQVDVAPVQGLDVDTPRVDYTGVDEAVAAAMRER